MHSNPAQIGNFYHAFFDGQKIVRVLLPSPRLSGKNVIIRPTRHKLRNVPIYASLHNITNGNRNSSDNSFSEVANDSCVSYDWTCSSLHDR